MEADAGGVRVMVSGHKADDEQARCWVIGVLDEGRDRLAPAAIHQLAQADLVVGDARFLEMFAPLFKEGVETRLIQGRIRELPASIHEAIEAGLRVAVLATGDPLFHGIGGYLTKHLPSDSLRVLGNISTLQAAFERLRLPWEEALPISVHRRDDGEWRKGAGRDHVLHPLWRAFSEAGLIGILTSPANGPDRIARMLLITGVEKHFSMTVCERLGSDQECILQDVDIKQVSRGSFASPNVVILTRKDPLPPVRGAG